MSYGTTPNYDRERARRGSPTTIITDEETKRAEREAEQRRQRRVELESRMRVRPGGGDFMARVKRIGFGDR